jgi:hypothetical protein
MFHFFKKPLVVLHKGMQYSPLKLQRALGSSASGSFQKNPVLLFWCLVYFMFFEERQLLTSCHI